MHARNHWLLSLRRWSRRCLMLVIAAGSLAFSWPACAIFITLEHTPEGENPPWDPNGTILVAHFQAAKTVWESLLLGTEEYEFDFHWDDDISSLGKASPLGVDSFIEINPNPPDQPIEGGGSKKGQWFADPTPLDNSEFDLPTFGPYDPNQPRTQQLYSNLSPPTQSSIFSGAAPPPMLETGYRATGRKTDMGAEVPGLTDVTSSNGYDLFSTILHEMGHILGISGVEPGGDYNIPPQFVGGLEDVLVSADDITSGHLAGNGNPKFLMCEGCGSIGERRFPTATDVLVIAEEKSIDQVRLARAHRIESGAFGDKNAWIGQRVPDITQDAYITQGGTVTVDGPYGVHGIYLDAGNTLDVGANRLLVDDVLDVTQSPTILLPDGGRILVDTIVGQVSTIVEGANATLELNNIVESAGVGVATFDFQGKVVIGAPRSGLDAEAPAAMNVRTDAVWNINNELGIGSGGTDGQVTIDDRASFTSDSGKIGASSGIEGGVVIATGGRWTVRNQLTAIRGTINVSSGVLQAASAKIGGNDMTATISAGGRFVALGNLDVVPGRGVLAIDAGEVEVGGDFEVEGSTTSESRTTVRNGGVLQVAGNILVAQHGALHYGTGSAPANRTIGLPPLKRTIESLPTDHFQGRGGRIRFEGDAIAGPVVVNNQASVWADGGGGVEFRDHASAAGGEYHSFGGTGPGFADFFDHATAGNGVFFNHRGDTDNGGMTRFYDNSSAGDATFNVEPASEGKTYFEFHEQSTAGDAVFNFLARNNNDFGEVLLRFDGQSDAGTATFTFADSNIFVRNGVIFEDNASARSAKFAFNAGVQADFSGVATAANAEFTLSDSSVNFFGKSKAGEAVFDLRNGSALQFSGDSDGTGLPTVSAQRARITVRGGEAPGARGSTLSFGSLSTPADAFVETNGGAVTGALGGFVDITGIINSNGFATFVTRGGVPGAQGGRLDIRATNLTAENTRIVTEAGGQFAFGAGIEVKVGSIEGAGEYSFGGGTLQTGSLNTDTSVAGPLLGFRLNKVGTGNFIIDSDNVSIFTTNVDAGRLTIDGNVNMFQVNVNNGGTLGGSGSIAGNVTVNPGGILDPGNSPGTLSLSSLQLDAASLLKMELGPVSDLINISGGGTLTLGGILDLSFTPGFQPTLGQQFTLFTGSVSAIVGSFEEVRTTSAPGFRFEPKVVGQSLIVEAVQIVPEPLNATMLASAALGALFFSSVNQRRSLQRTDPSGRCSTTTRWRPSFSRPSAHSL